MMLPVHRLRLRCNQNGAVAMPAHKPIQGKAWQQTLPQIRCQLQRTVFPGTPRPHQWQQCCTCRCLLWEAFHCLDFMLSQQVTAAPAEQPYGLSCRARVQGYTAPPHLCCWQLIWRRIPALLCRTPYCVVPRPAWLPADANFII